LRGLWDNKRQVFFDWLVATLVLLVVAGLITGLAWKPVSIIRYRNSHFYDQYLHGWVDYDREFSYDEAMAFAIRLDRIIDKIEEQDPDWYPIATTNTAYAWVAELAPQFHYEGAAMTVNYPLMAFAPAFHGGRHNHVAGQSNCEEAFTINLRFANPISVWHERGSWIATLAHELAHNHQGQLCYELERELIETTAQVMSWEVLAGLANQRNKYALFALLDTLRSDAMSMAWGMALEGDGVTLERFERDLRHLHGHDELRWASYQKSMRFWEGNRDELAWILVNYAAAPLNLVQEHRYRGVIPHLAIDTPTSDLKIDDLLYVLEHAEELVDQALENDAKTD
jgi:hypothetical protein